MANPFLFGHRPVEITSSTPFRWRAEHNRHFARFVRTATWKDTTPKTHVPLDVLLRDLGLERFPDETNVLGQELRSIIELKVQRKLYRVA